MTLESNHAFVSAGMKFSSLLELLPTWMAWEDGFNMKRLVRISSSEETSRVICTIVFSVNSYIVKDEKEDRSTQTVQEAVG